MPSALVLLWTICFVVIAGPKGDVVPTPLMAAMFVVLVGSFVFGRRDRDVAAADGGLAIGRRRIPRHALRDAWVHPTPQGAELVVATTDGRVDVLSTTEVERAKEIAAALGGGAARVGGARAHAIDFAVALGFLATALAAGYFVNLKSLIIVSLVLIARYVPVFLRRQVIAGSDGVEVRRAIGRRFVPYSRIERVEAEAIVLEGGSVLPIRASDLTVSVLGREAWPKVAHERLMTAIRERVAAAKGRREAPAEAAVAAERDEGAYRDPALPDSALWQVVESQAAAPAHRVRAAETLAERSPSARLRIADVASGVVDQELHRALVRVADDESEEEEPPNEKRRSS